MWNENQCLYQIFRHLVSYAKNTNLTVHSAISLEYLKDLFHLPLSQEAFLEFEELEVICGNTMQMIQEGNIDNLSYTWGNANGTSKRAYKVLISYQLAPPHFNWI
jgi:hypothetical protein